MGVMIIPLVAFNCHLLHVLSVSHISDYICTSIHLHIIIYNYYIYRWHSSKNVPVFTLGCYTRKVSLAGCT